MMVNSLVRHELDYILNTEHVGVLTLQIRLHPSGSLLHRAMKVPSLESYIVHQQAFSLLDFAELRTSDNMMIVLYLDDFLR